MDSLAVIGNISALEILTTHISTWLEIRVRLFSLEKSFTIFVCSVRFGAVSKYFTRLFCVCILWRVIDVEQITEIRYVNAVHGPSAPTFVWLKMDESSAGGPTNSDSEFDRKVLMGIERGGCQV